MANSPKIKKIIKEVCKSIFSLSEKELESKLKKHVNGEIASIVKVFLREAEPGIPKGRCCNISKKKGCRMLEGSNLMLNDYSCYKYHMDIIFDGTWHYKCRQCIKENL
jgi:hypothetical protein